MDISDLRRLLNTGDPLDVALDKIGMARSAELIRESEEDPRDIQYAIDYLKRRGIPQDIIENYVIFPSGRPRTSMRFIPNKNISKFPLIPKTYLTLKSDVDKVRISKDWWNKTVTLEQDLFVPVVRYQLGMRGNLYFDESKESPYCGTFYYFEPSSPYYLRSHKTLITPNKLTAIYHLWKLLPGSLIDLNSLSQVRASIKNIISTWVLWRKPLRGAQPLSHHAVAWEPEPNHQVNIPEETNRILDDLKIINGKPLSEESAEYYNNTILPYVIAALFYNQEITREGPEAAGYNEYTNADPIMGWQNWIRDVYYGILEPKWSKWMYATEDWFDMQICVAGQREKYDIIILTNITGGNRLVSEVYDVRNRDISFNNIYLAQ